MAGATGTFMSGPEHAAGMRDDWWHVVLATPFLVVAGGLIGGYIGVMLVLLSALLYPVAMRGDAKYVSETAASGGPNVRLATVLGIIVLLTLGLLSLVVSPYYLYRRRAYTT